MPPGDFIPLADEAGLIKPLTSYVLDAALRQCREWDDDGVAVRVAVNLDMRSLLDLHFVDEVEAALAKWNLAPDRLELEITEGTIMADPARVEEVTRLLSAMGVDLAIDDFGTGYSSLAYLRSLPIAEIKIDKSFVTGMGREGSAAAIVRGIVDLGRNLGLRVVAEGVETEEALKVLAELDCGFAQGFHLARPAPADELVEWLRNGARPVRSKRARRKKSGSGAATAVPGLAASSLRR
jgi:EAL domain-containing protein (putative c-di-GMP-specific phosphodiesterase class I)